MLKRWATAEVQGTQRREDLLCRHALVLYSMKIISKYSQPQAKLVINSKFPTLNLPPRLFTTSDSHFSTSTSHDSLFISSP